MVKHSREDEPEPECVCWVYWDGGGMINNGIERACRRGKMLFWKSETGCEFGPFRSLKDILSSDFGLVNETVYEIDCPSLSAPRIASLIHPQEDLEEGHSVEINGEEWVCRGSAGFQPAEGEREGKTTTKKPRGRPRKGT